VQHRIEEGKGLTGGAHEKKFNLELQTDPTLIWSKIFVTRIQQFKQKYQETGFEKMNNFCNWIFFIFEMEFELKIWECKVCFSL
jgi:hypothetical protein